MNKSSLAWRGTLALFLLIGFYIFSFVVALGLLYVPYAEIKYLNRIHIKLAMICIAGSGIILWSIFPRRDRFLPPGPRLLPTNQPRLFEELAKIASQVNQKMPEEVFLINEANAWVSQRGGILGIGSKRVMGIGIPLMRALNASEFRGVIAHEFGHFYGGDTTLTPSVYKTRSAIVRAILALGEHSSILQLPFIFYGKTFLRITHAVSRYQEYTADAVATHIVGTEAMISGLQKTHAADFAYYCFWEQEYLPVLAAGYYAPLADGFAKFLDEKWINDIVSKLVREEIAEPRTDPYDTHPPLRERIISIKNLRIKNELTDETPAISWLQTLPRIEKELLISIGGRKEFNKLKDLDWKDAVEHVYLPAWKERLMEPEPRKILDHLFVEQLSEVAINTKSLYHRLADTLPAKEKDEWVRYSIGAALAILLHQKGFQLECEPGSPIFCRKTDLVIQPFKILDGLSGNTEAKKAWNELCLDPEIRKADLGAVVRKSHWSS
jgi:Zn-dependent protease with chaperone function